MKALVLNWILGFLLVAGVVGGISYVIVKYDKPVFTQLDIDLAKSQVRDSTDNAASLDSVAIFNAGKKAESVNTEKIKSKATSLSNENKYLHVSSDSANARYERNKTIENCDSLKIKAKNEIAGLNREIDNAYDEAESYSKRLYDSEGAGSVKDRMIQHKDSVIASRDNTIGNIQCSKEWAIKNPFFAWLAGYECRKK